ncbi:MAG: hypothetical protein K8T89_16875 [Planctomycetes bacterium]|nr:hypothetical protein [Planctomycetota bacterium]
MYRMLIATFVLAITSSLSARAEDGNLDWLSPPAPRQPFWDLRREFPVSRPGDDFSDLLWNLSRAPADDGLRFDPGRIKLNRESSIEQVRLQSNLEMPDSRYSRENSNSIRDWKAAESLHVPLPIAESLFMFGQFDSSGEGYDQRQVRIQGKTGLGWKWTPFSGGEFQVRSGPILRTPETADSQRFLDRSQWSVEVQARVNLYGPLQIKYAGEALPALAQVERNTVLQDLKLAIPFGTNREMHIGGRYRWEEALNPMPWMQRTELYLGFKFQH